MQSSLFVRIWNNLERQHARKLVISAFFDIELFHLKSWRNWRVVNMYALDSGQAELATAWLLITTILALIQTAERMLQNQCFLEPRKVGAICSVVSRGPY
jgi:hypothetical protein